MKVNHFVNSIRLSLCLIKHSDRPVSTAMSILRTHFMSTDAIAKEILSNAKSWDEEL